MIVLFIILGCIGWFILGILGYIINQKFGDENMRDEFGLLFFCGGFSFVCCIIVVAYEHIRDFITYRF